MKIILLFLIACTSFSPLYARVEIQISDDPRDQSLVRRFFWGQYKDGDAAFPYDAEQNSFKPNELFTVIMFDTPIVKSTGSFTLSSVRRIRSDENPERLMGITEGHVSINGAPLRGKGFFESLVIKGLVTDSSKLILKNEIKNDVLENLKSLALAACEKEDHDFDEMGWKAIGLQLRGKVFYRVVGACYENEAGSNQIKSILAQLYIVDTKMNILLKNTAHLYASDSAVKFKYEPDAKSIFGEELFVSDLNSDGNPELLLSGENEHNYSQWIEEYDLARNAINLIIKKTTYLEDYQQ